MWPETAKEYSKSNPHTYIASIARKDGIFNRDSAYLLIFYENFVHTLCHIDPCADQDDTSTVFLEAACDPVPYKPSPVCIG